MHLGDGALTPGCALVGYSLAGVSALALWRTSPAATERKSLAEVVAWHGFVFAAQMVNIAVGDHSSAHLIGGVLLAHLFGARLAMVGMSLILTIQALLLGDGGVGTLGMNIVNMGAIPIGTYLLAMKLLTSRSSALSVAAVGSVIVASLLIPLEVSVGRSATELAALQPFMTQMIALHIPAAIFEGVVSVGLIGLLSLASVRWGAKPVSMGIASAAILLSITAAKISSALPDGYEAAAAQSLSFLLATSASGLAIPGVDLIATLVLMSATALLFLAFRWPEPATSPASE